MSQNRREFLKTLTAIGASTAAISSVTPNKAAAKSSPLLNTERKGVLVDTTVCIGCRKCEWACKGVSKEILKVIKMMKLLIT